jgi:hypothetical protein
MELPPTDGVDDIESGLVATVDAPIGHDRIVPTPRMGRVTPAASRNSRERCDPDRR